MAKAPTKAQVVKQNLALKEEIAKLTKENGAYDRTETSQRKTIDQRNNTIARKEALIKTLQDKAHTLSQKVLTLEGKLQDFDNKKRAHFALRSLVQSHFAMPWYKRIFMSTLV